jgi:hypothetical protein
MIITNSDKSDKRLKAIFSNGKTVHFGLKGGSTYIDHKDKKKRANYLARHKVRENWDDPYSAGALSRWLLWGDYPDLEKNHKAFMKKYTVM